MGDLRAAGIHHCSLGSAEQSSLDALRKASDTSYFKDKDALWVKVVSNGNGARPHWRRPGGGTSLQVSR